MLNETGLPVRASVVIGFRDWGIDRLLLSIKSIFASMEPEPVEVVVSDLGSADSDGNRLAVEEAGARYVYTPSPIWSRSVALNRGIENACGDYIFCTDADMIFAPGTLAEALRFLELNDGSIVLIQCRDLPESWDAEAVSLRGMLWTEFESSSRIRPRWGMGGLVGFSRSAYEDVRGLDERMHTYGGEDLDFAQRMQRSGKRITWLDSNGARMYHIWHPSSSAAADSNPEDAKAVAQNRSIVEKDPTILRNTTSSLWRGRDPLVSVVISTFNRADIIAESIDSVLCQTVSDFELIVVDDGSTDDTEAVVRSVGDPRIRYFRRENRGISSARNFGSDVARGRYIAVHDDDDLMLPDRLQKSLNAMRGGVRATFGSWVNFDDSTGEFALNVSRKDFSDEVLLRVGAAPGHSTWLVDADLMRRVRYDEGLSSAVDHNLASRLAGSGVKWAHCGAVLFLRRIHDAQVTEGDFSRQQSAAELTRRWVASNLSDAERKSLIGRGDKIPWPQLKEKEDLESFCVAWLPDHLCVRTVTVYGDIEPIVTQLESARRVASRVSTVRVSDGERVDAIQLLDVPWADLAALTRHGYSFSVEAVRRSGPTAPAHNRVQTHSAAVDTFVETVLRDRPSSRENSFLVIAGLPRDRRDAEFSHIGLVEGGTFGGLVLGAVFCSGPGEVSRVREAVQRRKHSRVWVVNLEH